MPKKQSSPPLVVVIVLLLVVAAVVLVSVNPQMRPLELASSASTPTATGHSCSGIAPIHSSEDSLTLALGQVASYTTSGPCGSTGARGMVLDQLPQGLTLIESHLTSAGRCRIRVTTGTWVYVAETGTYTSVGTETLPPPPGCCDSSYVWSFSSNMLGKYDVIFRGSGYASEEPCGEQLTLHITVGGTKSAIATPTPTSQIKTMGSSTATMTCVSSATCTGANGPVTYCSCWSDSVHPRVCGGVIPPECTAVCPVGWSWSDAERRCVSPSPPNALVDVLEKFWNWLRCLFGYC
jgi:hypothetical protein